MSTTEKIFANGFIVKRNDNAPEFVLASVSIKADEAIEFINANTNNGWVNLDLKRSQSGKCYAELNTWKPKTEQAPAAAPVDEESGDFPF